jgi:acetolactate synthase small subunit
MTEHTLHVLLRDNPGALHRAVTLFRRRGYNIRSLHVDRSETAGVSKMDVSFEAPAATQLAKELERFVDVLSVRNVTRYPAPPFVSTTPTITTGPSANAMPTTRTQADGVCDEEDIAV